MFPGVNHIFMQLFFRTMLS